MDKNGQNRGRPSALGKVDVEYVKSLALAGCTMEQIAAACCCSIRAVYRYMAKSSKFKAAVTECAELADAMVKTSLWERANGYSHPEENAFQYKGAPVIVHTTKHYPPDTAAAFIWLKNRKPKEWRDRKDIELSGEIKVSTVDSAGLISEDRWGRLISQN